MELRRYGVATTLYFPLIDKGGTDFEATPVTIASGDCQISKDGGAFANTTTASFVHEGGGIYSIPLTATEMQARVIVVKIIDQTGTKEWEDQAIVVATCGDASAEIPNLADAPVATVDTVVDAIKAKTDNLPSDPADASDIAGLLAAISAYIDTEVAAIKAKTDNLPSDPADASDIAALIDAIPTAIENADALLKRDLDQVEASAPVHSAASAFLKLVSRFVASNGRTYRTDGSTVHMTQTPTVDASADPITELGAAA